MSLKLKSILKRQLSWSVGQRNASEEEGASREKQEARKTEILPLRRKNARCRHRTSVGVLEDIMKCPICKLMLHSPRILPCQHTFCKKCLEAKLEESPKDQDSEKCLSCPVCHDTTKVSDPSTLPLNLSIESFLRALNGTFVERSSGNSNSLVVNFTSLTTENKRNTPRCSECKQFYDAADPCRHCNQVFCSFCQAGHVNQLKQQFKIISEQLQAKINKLEIRVLESKEISDNLKDLVTKDFDEKIAALNDEKRKKLELIDEQQVRDENSLKEIRQRVSLTQQELVGQADKSFDEMTGDKEKMSAFLDLHRKATEIISSITSWQPKLATLASATKNDDFLKSRITETSRTPIRPKLIIRKELHRPSGLAVDSRGEIYLACPGSSSIIVFDRQLRIMRRIKNPKMMAPQGLAFVDRLQQIFVTDKWQHCILVFNCKGQLVREIGEKGQAEGQLRCPEGIDVLQSRNLLYVADTGNDRVQILGVDGSYKGGIGPPNTSATTSSSVIIGVHNFNQPTDVAVSNNAVVVADCGHHKIKVFNHRGQLMFSIGGFGTVNGMFKSPEIVELDENNNIIVGDSDNGRIQVFSSQGEFRRSLGGHGTTFGPFGWISGLLCLPNSEVLVADSKNNTLQLF